MHIALNRAKIKKKKILSILSASGIHGILITDLNNIRYLSGFTGSSGFILITEKHSVFATDFRYQEQAKLEVRGFLIETESDERTKTILRLVKEYGILRPGPRIFRLGFEDHNLTYKTYRRLLKDKKIRLKPLKDTVESMRIIKSAEELNSIKIAAKRAEKAFRKLQPFIKAGATEQQLSLRLEGLLKKEGCKILPFGVIVASGRRSALPHAKPTSKALKRGDLVVFDWGGECNGYYSDMTRTVAIMGRHLGKQREIYANVLKAQKNAVMAVKPGINAMKIDSAARDFIKGKGYGDCFGHGTGHGIGLAVHEKPVISWQSKDAIKRGMVFTIEPGIYIPGFGGVRIEDMVHVAGNSAEVLTSLPRTLKII